MCECKRMATVKNYLDAGRTGRYTRVEPFLVRLDSVCSRAQADAIIADHGRGCAPCERADEPEPIEGLTGESTGQSIRVSTLA